MDLYQIITTHNRPWSFMEIIFFLIIFLITFSTLTVFVKRKKISPSQALGILLLFIYLAIVFESTVFTRNPGVRKYQLELFWSWKEILGIGECGRTGSMTQKSALLEENILNILLFFPIGLLLSLSCRRMLSWRRGLLAGVTISLCIETLQLLLCRGLFEWDDIIHNGLGCMIGVIVMNRLLPRKSNRRKNKEIKGMKNLRKTSKTTKEERKQPWTNSTKLP